MSFIPIFQKDLLIEFRTKYSFSTLFLFVFVVVALFYYNLHGQKLEPIFLSSIYWIVIYFASLSGLTRGFLYEEDKGTLIFLQLYSNPISVYTAKLLINLIMTNSINILTSLLFVLLLEDYIIFDIFHYALNTFLVSSTLSIIITLLSAIISKSNNKSSLLAVLSFPTVLPMILLGSNDLANAFIQDKGFVLEDFIFMLSYSGLITIVSYFLFEFIWKD